MRCYAIILGALLLLSAGQGHAAVPGTLEVYPDSFLRLFNSYAADCGIAPMPSKPNVANADGSQRWRYHISKGNVMVQFITKPDGEAVTKLNFVSALTKEAKATENIVGGALSFIGALTPAEKPATRVAMLMQLGIAPATFMDGKKRSFDAGNMVIQTQYAQSSALVISVMPRQTDSGPEYSMPEKQAALKHEMIPTAVYY